MINLIYSSKKGGEIMRTVVKKCVWGGQKVRKNPGEVIYGWPSVYSFLIMFELDQVRRNGYENL